MTHTCNVCSKTFEHKANLVRHMNKHEGKTFICDICWKPFNDQSNLKKHQKCVHAGEAAFMCNTCQASFKQKTHLQAHELRHSQVKEFNCGICDKLFSRKKILETHMRTHTQEKLFKCSICPKSFNHKSGLQFHMGKHTGVVGFQCTYCIKQFDRKANLQRHLLTHTGEKPFTCGVCARGFNQKTLLEAHVKRYHNVIQTEDEAVAFDSLVKLRNPPKESYKFGCKKCDKTFNTQGNLNRHVRSKHDRTETSILCDLCGDSYSSQYFLDVHVQMIHGSLNPDCALVERSDRSVTRCDSDVNGTACSEKDGYTDVLEMVYSSADINQLLGNSQNNI